MKQHITINQLNELTVEQKTKLSDLYKDVPHNGFNQFSTQPETETTLPLLSIGQMIELLGWEEIRLIYYPYSKYMQDKYDVKGAWLKDYDEPSLEPKDVDIVDLLWKAVKEVL